MRAPRLLINRVVGPAARRHNFFQAHPIVREFAKPISSATQGPRRRSKGLTAFAFAFAGSGLLAVGLSFPSFSYDHDLPAIPNRDDRDPKLPRFKLSEIRKHDGKSENPWVTHGDKVYDITDWVAAHPGGEVILRAAGGSIDPYWNIFTIHKTAYVYDILDQYKIGFIDVADLVDGKPAAQEIEDPFQDDPLRDPRLITITPKPRNAETPPEGLSDSFLTPNELFYVRNHMWVPSADDDEFRLKVELLDGTTREYTLEELQNKFKRTKITATLQCSGNRRKDMTTHARKTNGLQWNVGAISCAEWEVLADAGFPVQAAIEGNSEAKHVQFSGSEAYGASIPIHAALDPRGDVILAYSMNGKPLPRDHGAPLRAIVPGHVAARSVKWLSHITVSDEESHSQWQRKDYKCFGPNESSPDWDKAPAIQEMPVNSATTVAKLDGGKAMLQGWAYSGGGRNIIRVDVSLDDGKTWDQAELLDDKALGRKSWSWRRWRYEGAISLNEEGEDNKKCSTILVKATDEAYNSQPESHNGIYNQRGNLANAWHRLRVCSDCTG